MKAVIALFLFAMVVCAMSQYYPSYGYGYNTYTPGARVSHYASGSYAPGHYGNYYGGYPYRYY